MISSSYAQFSCMLSICRADSGFPKGSIFAKYCFMKDHSLPAAFAG